VRRRLLIVDDHAGFRKAAAALLAAEGFEVVGHAGDAGAAIRQIALLRPDVVLLDIQLPGLDGIALAELISHEPDPPDVVLISSREASAYGDRLGSAPTRGFLPKRGLSGAKLAVLVR
jgi:DNA-binding NarL/FixJ family response regulator